MKVLVYGALRDEYPLYDEAAQKLGFAFDFAPQPLTLDTVAATRGYEGLIIVTRCHITPPIAAALAQNGVRYVTTRSTGTDHMDLRALHHNGILAANVPFYAPAAIAEHTILLALAVLRHAKRESALLDAGDFSLSGLKGRQLGSLTAGVLGTGRIGRETVRLLHGFGCTVLASDPHPSEEVAARAAYLPRKELIAGSDIVFLHCPLNNASRHVIDDKALSTMRPGSYLINTARGGLVDAGAVLAALETGRLAGFGFDVYENETAYLRKKVLPSGLQDTVLTSLLRRQDAYYTAHMAFYTDEAVEAMIRTSIQNLMDYALTGTCENEVRT